MTDTATPSENTAPATTPFEEMGGVDTVRRLSTRFYEIMNDTPAAAGIRNMHEADLGPIAEKLTGYLTGWFGGPRDYFEREDSPCIMSAHAPYDIGPEERDQWLACMKQALEEETQISDKLRTEINTALYRMADGMRSR